MKNLKTFEGYFDTSNDKVNKTTVDADCDTCKDGKTVCVNCSSNGRDREACNVCKGTGFVDCADCNGLSDCSNKDIVCKCGWGWNKDESNKKDMYKCHECGEDNTKKYKK